jgi:hypothetical protein
MSYVPLISEALASQVLHWIVSKLEEGLSTRIKSEVDLIEERLVRIEEKIEKNMAMHLRAGLSFMRMGNWREAKNEFVRAEAVDSHSAMAKFWLGLILYRGSSKKLAAEKLRDSLHMNPYIIPSSIMTLEQLQKKFSLKPNSRATWTIDLTSSSCPDNLQYKTINAVSLSGGNPVLDAGLGVIAAVDISNGKYLWSKDTYVDRGMWKDGIWKELYFATPYYVVLKSHETPTTYELLDMQTGRSKTTMGQEYFEAIFCPNNSQLTQLDAFKRANCKVESSHTKVLKFAQTAYKNRKARLPLLKRVTHEIYSAFDFNYKYWDEKEITDPLDAKLYRLNVRNDWKGKYALGSPGLVARSSNVVKTVQVHCESKITRLS